MKIDKITKTEIKLALGTILIMGFANMLKLLDGRYIAFFLFGALYWDLASDIIRAKHKVKEMK